MKIKTLMLTALLSTTIFANALASPTLSKNATGDDVLTLQKRLYLIGYTITEFDGVFGAETEKAVSQFQKDKNISVTGIVTNVTWRALQKAKTVKGRNLKDIKEQIIATVKKGKENTPAATGSALNINYGKTFISGKQGAAIVATAKKFTGVPYVFGGTTPKGFDCSGFLQYVFRQHGINIPRLADEQYKLGKNVKVSQLEVGYLVFFSTYTAGVSHCGIYVGDGKFLHTSSSRGVRIDSLSDSYWKPRFVGGKKIIH